MFTKEAFEIIPRGTPITVRGPGVMVEGYYGGTAVWEDKNEKEQYEGFVVEEATGYMHWIPWDVTQSIELFNA